MAYALQVPQFARRSPVLGFIVLMHAVVIYFINAEIDVIEIPVPTPIARWIDIAPDRKPEEQKPDLRPKDPVGPARVEQQPEPPTVVLEAQPPETIAVGPDPGPIDSGALVDVERTLPTLDPRRPIGRPPYPAQS